MKKAKIFMSMFAFIGIFLVGTIIHENIHRWDYRDILKTDEEICYLTFGNEGAFGYYQFYTTEPEEVDKIRLKSEIRAYSVNFILTLIYLLCLFELFWSKEK